MYKIYIGSNNKEAIISPETEAHIVETFSTHFESFTYHRAKGVFKGKKEDTLIVHITNVDFEDLKKTVSDLRKELNQEGIGIDTGEEYIRVVE